MSDMDLGTLRGHVELDIAQFDRKYAEVDTLLNQLEGRQVPDVRVGADVTQAELRLGDVDRALVTIGGETATAKVDADASLAESSVNDIQGVLDAFDGETAEATVTADGSLAETEVNDARTVLEQFDGETATADLHADASRAEAEVGQVERMLSDIDGEVATAKVDADTSAASGAIDDLGGQGEAAGEVAGEGMAGGILGSLKGLIGVGAVVGIGVGIGAALWKGIEDGMDVEVERDMFAGRTGLDEATAGRFGRAAGAAYADAFGESVEGNLEVARLALGEGLLDENATDADIQHVVKSLTSITDIFEYDMPALTAAVGRMLKTGLVDDATEAFDLITAGSQGMIADDLMDTLIEYSSQFETLGLDGEQAMGVIRQAMDEGARDTDKVADAFKELGLRIREGTDPAREALDNLGLDVDGIIAAMTAGGPEAAGALDEVFDALRTLEENGGNTQEVIANLFGGPGEDLGASLFAIDVGTAADALGEVEGAAERAIAAVNGNEGTEWEAATRHVEVAADGIKGALAAAFSEPLSNIASWVTGNQAGVLEFFGLIGNAAFTMAEATVEGAATMIEAIGKIPSAFMPVIEHLTEIVGTYNLISTMVPGMPGVPDSMIESLGGAADRLRDMEGGAEDAADALRRNLIDDGITPAQEAFNGFLDDEIVSARVSDASHAMAEAIGSVGEKIEEVDGLEFTLDGKLDRGTDAGYLLDEQLRATVESMEGVQAAAYGAGEGQAELTRKWQTGYDALILQLEAMGFTTQEAKDMAEAYGMVPEQIETSATLEKAQAVNSLNDLLVLVDESTGTITVNGDRTPADATLGELIGDVDVSDGTVTINGDKYPADATLEEYLGVLNTSGGTVTINGMDLPARSTLGSLVGDVNESDGTVTINGNKYPADMVLGSFLSKVGTSSATAKVLASTWSGQQTVDNFIYRNDGRSITTYQRVVVQRQPVAVATGGDVDALATGLAGGGPVVGPGTGTSDDVPASHPSGVAFALSNGEHVWTDAEVDAVGGHAGVYRLRDMALSGELARLLDAGTPTINTLAENSPAPAYAPARAGAGVGAPVDLSGLEAAVERALTAGMSGWQPVVQLGEYELYGTMRRAEAAYAGRTFGGGN